MKLQTPPPVEIPSTLLEAIRCFPAAREVEHCGRKINVSPFDFYTTCPQCGCRMKLRAFSANHEIEDVFDAVFEWMNQPGAREVALQRQRAIAADSDE
jgi:hypothetical protein